MVRRLPIHCMGKRRSFSRVLRLCFTDCPPSEQGTKMSYKIPNHFTGTANEAKSDFVYGQTEIMFLSR